MKDKPSARDMILQAGFVLTADWPDCIEAENELFRLRHYPGSDLIELGVLKTFDRWSNSTDFSFRIPKTEKGWAKRFDAATADALAGRHDLPPRGAHPRERYVNRSRF